MSEKKQTFEQVYTKLSETVRAMEQPDVTLEESMKLYEQAGRLVVECEKILRTARGEITDIHSRLESYRAAELSAGED